MTYDQWKTDSGYAEKTPEQENEGRDCPVCGGDCAGANPPVYHCPMKDGPLPHPLEVSALSIQDPASEPVACGGCGNSDPAKRCLGCMHSFFERDWPEKYATPTSPPARFSNPRGQNDHRDR